MQSTSFLILGSSLSNRLRCQACKMQVGVPGLQDAGVRYGRETTAREHSRTALDINPNLPPSIIREIRLIVR